MSVHLLQPAVFLCLPHHGDHVMGLKQADLAVLVLKRLVPFGKEMVVSESTTPEMLGEQYSLCHIRIDAELIRLQN